jgi:hypothetical protein
LKKDLIITLWGRFWSFYNGETQQHVRTQPQPPATTQWDQGHAQRSSLISQKYEPHIPPERQSGQEGRGKEGETWQRLL